MHRKINETQLNEMTKLGLAGSKNHPKQSPTHPSQTTGLATQEFNPFLDIIDSHKKHKSIHATQLGEWCSHRVGPFVL